MKEGIGKGELHSPDHTIKINTNNHHQNNTPQFVPKKDYYHHQEVRGSTMVGRGVANDIKNKMGVVKERLMVKLAAASVPSDSLGNARHFLESVIKDVTSAAKGRTKEALQKIKSHFADILPSLSPSLTSKMVDDAEREATTRESRGDEAHEGKELEGENNEEYKGKAYASPVSPFFSNYLVKPTSRL